MPSWDAESRFKLLLAVIDVVKPGSPDWDQVAVRLGGSMTGNAARQQYQKIRKMVGSELHVIDDPGAGPSKSTPSAAISKKRKQDKAQIDGDYDKDNAGSGRPRKPVKKEVKIEPKDYVTVPSNIDDNNEEALA